MSVLRQQDHEKPGKVSEKLLPKKNQDAGGVMKDHEIMAYEKIALILMVIALILVLAS